MAERVNALCEVLLMILLNVKLTAVLTNPIVYIVYYNTTQNPFWGTIVTVVYSCESGCLKSRESGGNRKWNN